MGRIASVLASLAVAAISASTAKAATVEVYSGFSYGTPIYNEFYRAKGVTSSALNTGFSASDLAGTKLIILSPIRESLLSSTQLSILSTFVHDGGRLLVASDGGNFYPQYIAGSNSVLSALGSSIVNNVSNYGASLEVTKDIAKSAFTDGVDSIAYGLTSDLKGGDLLFNGKEGQRLGAYEAIGKGFVFALADANLVDNITDNRYGDGRLFDNFLSATVSTVPLPASAPMFGAALIGLAFVRRPVKRMKV